ncbi:MAG: toxin-antitoxin system HicB family antitoxin [Bacteroidales bacterium]|jgi:antitoxin HicB|nr:toxin-antitoxin system HicB family antitoxin [Bacteroidales bacterium]
MYNLEYYKSLEYRVIIEKDSFEEENWYIAYAHELGKKACYGEGDTPQEALDSFLEVKDEFINMLFDLGKKIPEPDPNIDYEGCNGSISLRTTPQTHAYLLREAKRAGTSLNLFLNNLILLNLNQSLTDEIFKKIALLESKLDKHHRYAEMKIISYEKAADQIITEIDQYADATEYWLANKLVTSTI